MLLGAMSLFSNDLAIDLGTANTCVFARGAGIVLNEPSIVAVNNVNDQIEAVGNEAKEMLGRTPGSITAIRPMRDGVIADFDAAEKMLGYFIKKAHRRKSFVRPRVVIGVPSEITQVERRAVKDSAYRAKASEVHLIEEGMAAAIGAGLPITEASGNMIVDIGGGTTDIAVISLAGIVYSKSVRVAGNAMDEAIIALRQARARPADRRAHGRAHQDRARVGGAAAASARRWKSRAATCSKASPPRSCSTTAQIREALAEPVRQIVQAVRDALERIPPELSADVCDRGIVLSGGGALLQQPRRAAAPGDRPARAGGRRSAVVGGAGRRQDAVGLQAAAEDLDRLRLGARLAGSGLAEPLAT